eukprot:TRINITY_DN112564_c0_g1_i1.p2 TRINITY_DN112564_c0_g1~~TRINITY_DN112564_c0_g1_i1.p2  ORF type:complete len:135 (-),score=12.31 TRINITY_DN112564_c0_g1_i1:362-766(-)
MCKNCNAISRPMHDNHKDGARVAAKRCFADFSLGVLAMGQDIPTALSLSIADRYRRVSLGISRPPYLRKLLAELVSSQVSNASIVIAHDVRVYCPSLTPVVFEETSVDNSPVLPRRHHCSIIVAKHRMSRFYGF